MWRRRWDSNPRVGYPTNAFRVRPVMATSVLLHFELFRRTRRSWTADQDDQVANRPRQYSAKQFDVVVTDRL